MNDSHSARETSGDTGPASAPKSPSGDTGPASALEFSSGDSGAPPRTPRWVKVFGIIFLVVLLLIVVALATGLGGPGDHGPGRHLPSGDARRQTSVSSGAKTHGPSASSLAGLASAAESGPRGT